MTAIKSKHKLFNFLVALSSAVFHRWICSSCVESNLLDCQHCKMDYVTIASYRTVPRFFFFQRYRESKAAETNNKGCCVKPFSVCLDGSRLCRGILQVEAFSLSWYAARLLKNL